MIRVFLFGVLAVMMVGCAPSVDQSIEISTLGDQMSYDVTSFTVTAGTTVSISFTNVATIPVMIHNVVILNDRNAIDEVGQRAISAINHLPDHPAILSASPLAKPGERVTWVWQVPKTPGDYPFICTFPGHYAIMQGTMKVVKSN